MDDELWTGTNESQFSAVPAGYYHSNACGGLGFCSINTVNFIWFGDTPARNTDSTNPKKCKFGIAKHNESLPKPEVSCFLLII